MMLADQHDPLGETLKSARIRAGLTQREVQTLTGIDHADVSRFESGPRHPTPIQLHDLAATYGLDQNLLLLEAGVLELPGFGSLVRNSEEQALDQLLVGATLTEKRELAKHLAAQRMI